MYQVTRVFENRIHVSYACDVYEALAEATAYLLDAPFYGSRAATVEMRVPIPGRRESMICCNWLHVWAGEVRGLHLPTLLAI